MLYKFLFVGILDSVSYLITSFFQKKVHFNSRWFFIHFNINLISTIFTLPDLIDCLDNHEICTLEKSSPMAYYATELVLVSHLYHSIVFYPHLKRDDIIHHLTMCGFNGMVFYYQGLKIQSVTSFFCSGLPGMIDYFLLYLVKIGKLDKKIEKDVYLFLSTYIRSPGCMLNTFLILPFFRRPQALFDLVISFIATVLVFWNGQYYMSKTCVDYGKNILKMKSQSNLN